MVDMIGPYWVGKENMGTGTSAGADDHVLLTEGSGKVRAGLQSWYIAEAESKASYTYSVDLLTKRLPLAFHALHVSEQIVCVYFDVRECSHRVVDGSTYRSLREQGGGDSSAHAGTVGQMDRKASHALLLAINDQPGKDYSDFGNTSKWSCRRHRFCCRRRWRVKIETGAIRRQCRCSFDVTGIKNMANFCKHELSVELEVGQLLGKRQQVRLLLGVWRNRAHAEVPVDRDDDCCRGIDHTSTYDTCSSIPFVQCVGVEVNSPSR